MYTELAARSRLYLRIALVSLVLVSLLVWNLAVSPPDTPFLRGALILVTIAFSFIIDRHLRRWHEVEGERYIRICSRVGEEIDKHITFPGEEDWAARDSSAYSTERTFNRDFSVPTSPLLHPERRQSA